MQKKRKKKPIEGFSFSVQVMGGPLFFGQWGCSRGEHRLSCSLNPWQYRLVMLGWMPACNPGELLPVSAASPGLGGPMVRVGRCSSLCQSGAKQLSVFEAVQSRCRSEPSANSPPSWPPLAVPGRSAPRQGLCHTFHIALNSSNVITLATGTLLAGLCH